jgi:hypothetical protein
LFCPTLLFLKIAGAFGFSNFIKIQIKIKMGNKKIIAKKEKIISKILLLTLHQPSSPVFFSSITGILFNKVNSVLDLVISKELGIYLYLIL